MNVDTCVLGERNLHSDAHYRRPVLRGCFGGADGTLFYSRLVFQRKCAVAAVLGEVWVLGQ